MSFRNIGAGRMKGSIEISTTPFYHPILPLLVNSQVDDGNVPVVFRFPEDAMEQLRRSREFMQERFGRYPQGLVAVGRFGFRMMSRASCLGLASDGWPPMKAFWRNPAFISETDNGHRLYQPYRRDGVTVFFRDRNLSDLIGFHYMHGSPRDGAEDLVRRIKEIPDGGHVTIALDGENPWDYYANSGRDFLRFLYDRIQKEPGLEARDAVGSLRSDAGGEARLAGARFLGRREFRYLDRPLRRSSGLGMDRARASRSDGAKGTWFLPRNGIWHMKSCLLPKEATGCGGSEMIFQATATPFSTRCSASTLPISIT